MCFVRTGPTKSGTGCCGSPNDSVINGLAGWYGAGALRHAGRGGHCHVRNASTFKSGRGTYPTTGNTSNHHRYGEVKTRLTIDPAGQFAWYYHIYTKYYQEESDGN